MANYKKLCELGDELKQLEDALKAGDIAKTQSLTDNLKNIIKEEKRSIAADEKIKYLYACSTCPLKCWIITKFEPSVKILHHCLQIEKDGEAAFEEIERQTEK